MKQIRRVKNNIYFPLSSSRKQYLMQMYEVEAIVGKRINPETKIIEYQVKWFGYPSEQNTWQPEKNLVFVKNLIRQFNQKAEINGDNFFTQKNQNAPQEKGKKKSLQEIVENLNESDNEELHANIYFQQESESQNEKQKNDPPKKSNQGKSNNIKQQLQNKKPLEPPKLNKVIEKKQVETNQLSKRTSHKPIPKQVQQKSITKQILDREQSQLYNNFSRRRQGPPPLPPDFAINKTKYIDPIISRKSSYPQVPFKHKIIEKERIREEKKKIQLMSPSTQKVQEMKNRKQRNQLHDKSYYKPSSKLIPPPPPPPFLTPRHQPIVQQNYFSNQYQLYNPSISAPVVERPHELSNSFSTPTAQYSYTREHAYEYNYTDQILDRSLDRNSNKYLKQGKHEENLQVYKVLNMEKRRDVYYYYAETNMGEMWLDRSQIVPMFSTALVLFYEQYLTFQG